MRSACRTLGGDDQVRETRHGPVEVKTVGRPSGPRRLALIALPALFVALAVMIGGPVLALVAVAGLTITLASLRVPGIVFAAYLLLAFYKGGVQPFSPIDLTVVLAGLTTIQIVPVLRRRALPAVSEVGLGLWLLLSLLIVAGVWYAPDQDLALDRAVRWWLLVVIPIICGGLAVGSDPRHLRHFLWSFFVMGLIAVVLGLASLSSAERLTVLNTNTIQVARAALLVPLLGIVFVLRERITAISLSLLLAIPAAIVVAIASGSRGPLLFLAVLAAIGTASYFAHPSRVKWNRVVGVAGLGIVSVLLLSIVQVELPSLSLERFSLFGAFVDDLANGTLTTTVGDTSAGSRIILFQAAGSMFGDHPVFGVGTSGFEALAPRYLSPDELEAWPHNALIQTAAEFGLVGISIFVSIVILALRRPIPVATPALALKVLFSFFFLNAMVSGDIFSDRETWGLLMLILLVDGPRAIERALADRDLQTMPAELPRAVRFGHP